MEPEPEKHFAGLIPAWHHVDCFLDNLDELDAVGVVADELSGFTKLKKEDKDDLKTRFKSKGGGTKEKKKGLVLVCSSMKMEPVSCPNFLNVHNTNSSKKRKVDEDSQPLAVKKSKEEAKEEKAMKVSVP